MADAPKDGDWAWTLPSGRQVRIDDLSIEAIERIAGQTGISWMTLMRYPGQSPTMAWDVYLECCTFAGEEPMEKPANAGEFLDFVALVEKIPKDRSTSFGDGGVPLEGESSTD